MQHAKHSVPVPASCVSLLQAAPVLRVNAIVVNVADVSSEGSRTDQAA
jgi:hypothetical protein